MKPKIDFDAVMREPCSEAQIEANMASARALGCPDVSALSRSHDRRLAIVGGGPSIRQRVHALRTWHGDVWAINNAAVWCVHNKIRCSMFTIESDPLAPWDPALGKIVRRAILSTRCDPSLFALLRSADIATYDIAKRDIGPGSAVNAMVVGNRLGYHEFTFFGCEGSYRDRHHAYAQDDGASEDKAIMVACAGKRFRTRTDLFNTSLGIALMCRGYPDQVKQRSGGLLAALVEDIDYEVVGISPGAATSLTEPALVAAYLAFAP